VVCYREVLRCTMITHQVLLRGAAQCYLLHSALCLTQVVRQRMHEVDVNVSKSIARTIVELLNNFDTDRGEHFDFFHLIVKLFFFL